jgi:uncharacterized membrane-anchored protein
MSNLKRIVILLNLVVLLIYFNWSVGEKEQLLSSGETVLFELAPVDPRSLMQGDYMLLNYAVSTLKADEKISKNGYCVFKTDQYHVARKVRLQDDSLPLNAGEKVIKYHANNTWNIKLGAESYFFEEGTGEKFEKAKFGGLKIDKEGNSVLTGLYGADHQLIKP